MFKTGDSDLSNELMNFTIMFIIYLFIFFVDILGQICNLYQYFGIKRCKVGFLNGINNLFKTFKYKIKKKN